MLSDGSTITPPTTPECYIEGRVNSRVLENDFSDLQFSVVGPIEICVNGQYESLCDIGWDEVDGMPRHSAINKCSLILVHN